jgi:thioredoxin reductase (NADPH)
MALGRADTILVRPWDPADHWLYPRIGMLLDRWVQATEQPGVCAVRIVMEPDAPYAHELRDELYRNAVPFQSFRPDSPHGRVVKPATIGGQAATTSMIRNYLGFPWGVSGKGLMEWVPLQASQFGAEMVIDRVFGLSARGRQQVITLAGGSQVTSDAVVVSIGVQYRRLSAPGVEELLGAGVFYGASLCEAPATRNRTAYIVGGGNSAGQAAVYLAEYAEHVTILVRRESLSATMSSYLIDQIRQLSNVTVRPNTEVIRAGGAGRLEQLTLCNSVTRQTEDVEAGALFVLAGAQLRTDWLPTNLARDDAGFLLTGPDLSPTGGLPVGWPPGPAPIAGRD